MNEWDLEGLQLLAKVARAKYLIEKLEKQRKLYDLKAEQKKLEQEFKDNG